jgi:hypothetical protein
MLAEVQAEDLQGPQPGREAAQERQQQGKLEIPYRTPPPLPLMAHRMVSFAVTDCSAT